MRSVGEVSLLAGLVFSIWIRIMRLSFSAPVAQLDRVSGYEPEGRAFESLRARQKNNQATTAVVFLFFGGYKTGVCNCHRVEKCPIAWR